MGESYYEKSTLYAMGVLFAYNRTMLLEGIYSQMEGVISGLGNFLRDKLNELEKQMDDQFTFKKKFYRYDRLALADFVSQRVNDRFQISTYLEFVERYEQSDRSIVSTLQPAKDFVNSLDGSEVATIMKALSDIAHMIKERTDIKTIIPTPIKD